MSSVLLAPYITTAEHAVMFLEEEGSIRNDSLVVWILFFYMLMILFSVLQSGNLIR